MPAKSDPDEFKLSKPTYQYLRDYDLILVVLGAFLIFYGAYTAFDAGGSSTVLFTALTLVAIGVSVHLYTAWRVFNRKRRDIDDW